MVQMNLTGKSIVKIAASTYRIQFIKYIMWHGLLLQMFPLCQGSIWNTPLHVGVTHVVVLCKVLEFAEIGP